MKPKNIIWIIGIFFIVILLEISFTNSINWSGGGTAYICDTPSVCNYTTSSNNVTLAFLETNNTNATIVFLQNNTNYNLNSSLTFNWTGTTNFVTLNGHNMTYNCNGSVFAGNNNGVFSYVTNQNATIRNCNEKYFKYGIQLGQSGVTDRFLADNVNLNNNTEYGLTVNNFAGANDFEIRNSTMTFNGIDGAYLGSSVNTHIKNSTFSNNTGMGINHFPSTGTTFFYVSYTNIGSNVQTGLFLEQFLNVNINNSIINNNLHGIDSDNSYNFTIINTSFISNTNGIRISATDNNFIGSRIINSTFAYNSGNGIGIGWTGLTQINARDLIVDNNNFTSNGNGFFGATAINLPNSRNYTITNNVMFNNGIAINLEYTNLSTIKNNTISNSSTAGIRLLTSSLTIILNNTIINTTGNGIDLSSSHWNVIINNTINNVSSYGITLASSTWNNATENIIDKVVNYSINFDVTRNNSVWKNHIYSIGIFERGNDSFCMNNEGNFYRDTITTLVNNLQNNTIENSTERMSYSPITYNGINFSDSFRIYNAGLDTFVNISADNTDVSTRATGTNGFHLWLIDISAGAGIPIGTFYIENTTANTCAGIATTYSGTCYYFFNNALKITGGGGYTFTDTFNSTYKVIDGFVTPPNITNISQISSTITDYGNQNNKECGQNITSPINNTNFTVNNININLFQSRRNDKTLAYNLFVNGIFDSVSESSFTKSFSDGTYRISFSAYDGTYNSTTAKEITFSVLADVVPSVGGGGGKVTPTEVFGIFAIEETSVKLATKVGQEKIGYLTITNIGKETVTISIINNLKEYISLTDKISLAPLETKKIPLTINYDNPGIYNGNLILKTSGLEKTIPVIIEILSKIPLVDISLYIPEKYREIKIGDKLKTEINLLGRIEDYVNIIYSIKDLTGLTILEKNETIFIGDQKSLMREFILPPNIKEGDYLFSVQTIYKDSFSVSNDIFKVKKTFKEYKIKPGYIIIGIIVSLIVLFIILRRHKAVE